MSDDDLLEWLQDGDPAIRAQVLRDLTDADADAVARERDRIPPVEGAGAALLAAQRPDGQWGVGVYDSEGWDSTTDALWLLHELDPDPAAPEVVRATSRVAEHVRWEQRFGGRPFFDGEAEACVNGRVLLLGARFGHPSTGLTDRILSAQLTDGGWNCDAPESIRASFHSTICVLEGLLAVERLTGDTSVRDARRRGEEYLLERGLLRSRSTGALLDESWLLPHVPTYWVYDVLRGLEHLRAAGYGADERLRDAVESVRVARNSDGTWPNRPHPGRPVIEIEPATDRSRWVTLRALRTLRWAEISGSTTGSRTTTRRR